MLDAVITWVDGNDKIHQQKRNEWIRQYELAKLRNESLSCKRFDDSGELYYCINLIRKNAHFIRKIFLVTDQQIPGWLTETVATELNVIIIDHQDIFGADKDILPTFNSTSIEGYIHNIEDLSDRFIYLNDDFFIIRKTKLSDFICNEKLIFRGSYFVRGFNRLWTIIGCPAWLPFGGLNSYKGFKKDRLLKTIPFCRAHAPYVCDKNELYAVFERKQRRENSKYKFRTLNQLNPLDIHFNRLLRKKKARIVRDDWFYMTATSFKSKPPENDILKINKNNKFKFLCIQELSEADENDYFTVLTFLNKLLSQ